MAQQDGTLFVVGNACYLKYYTIGADGKRVRNTARLCAKSDVYDWSSKSKKGSKQRKWSFSRAVIELQRETMGRIKAEAAATTAATMAGKNATPGEMRVVDFWEQIYLPYLEAVVPLTGKPRRAPSTMRGFKQIWNQHLSPHFGTTTLKDYEPAMGKRFLRSLIDTQGKNTLKHIKSVASSLFGHAVNEEFIKTNPWHDVSLPEDAIQSAETKHYTLEEAEDIISALVEHVDCQLLMALNCFLGLRPGEAIGLKWDDFDGEMLCIRRSIVRGIVGTPKTKESVADIPLVDPRVIVPLELWRQCKSRPQSEWVFANDDGSHLYDSSNIIYHKIRPALKKAGLEWKTLYAGRRGACTAAIEATDGNYAVAQQLLRHKSMQTTLNVYKKQITPAAFKAGMKKLAASTGRPLELAAKNGSE